MVEAQELEKLKNQLTERGAARIMARFCGVNHDKHPDWNPLTSTADLFDVMKFITKDSKYDFAFGKNRAMILLVNERGDHMRAIIQEAGDSNPEKLLYSVCMRFILDNVKSAYELNKMLSHPFKDNDNDNEKENGNEIAPAQQEQSNNKTDDGLFRNEKGMIRIDYSYETGINEILDRRAYATSGNLLFVDKDGNIQFEIMADPKADDYERMPNKPFNHSSEKKGAFSLRLPNDLIDADIFSEWRISGNGKPLNIILNIDRIGEFGATVTQFAPNTGIMTVDMLQPLVEAYGGGLLQLKPAKKPFS